MIYLNERDILDAAPTAELVEAMAEALLTYDRGEFLMPERMHVDSGQNTLLLMPCFIEDYFATKLVTLFPGNPQKGVPVLNGIVVLNDGGTGVPVALLDGPVLTGLRTAAVAAVSIRHLAPPGTRAIGIVGAGVQGFYQGWLGASACGAAELYVHDIVPEKAVKLAERLTAVLPGVKVRRSADVTGLLEACQVVVTATTSSEPVLPDEPVLLRGRHFVGIGSYKPDVREFPPSLFELLETVFVDTDQALAESGDLIIPLARGWITQEQVMTLGRYLRLAQSGEQARGETTFFKSVGMALFDVCAAKLVYERARQKGLGRELPD